MTEVLYSLVLLFTINGIQHSESSQNSLTREQCHSKSVLLMDGMIDNPPFFIDQYGQPMVIVSSNPTYVCVPTSIK
jgi:hypothetical protein